MSVSMSCLQGGVGSGVVWARIAYVQRLWGIPSRASEDDDETKILVLARVCEVLYWNKLSAYNTTGRLCYLFICCRCWPQSLLLAKLSLEV